MKAFAFAFLAFFVLARAWGQAVDAQVLKRAQRLSEQNNARQRALSGQESAAQPAPAAPAQPDPALAATLQNIARLQADLASLESDPARKQPLINDFNAAAQGTHSSEQSASDLARDLATAIGGKQLSPEHLKKLAQDSHAIFNSSHLTPAQQKAVLEDVQKTLQSNGAPPDLAMKVVEGFKAVAAETK
jgi:chorismate mutase